MLEPTRATVPAFAWDVPAFAWDVPAFAWDEFFFFCETQSFLECVFFLRTVDSIRGKCSCSSVFLIFAATCTAIH